MFILNLKHTKSEVDTTFTAYVGGQKNLHNTSTSLLTNNLPANTAMEVN